MQHPMTSWAENPNYVLEGSGFYGNVLVTEQLWANILGEGLFELACLPFYLYGFALGDHVSVESDGTLKCVHSSGRKLYRVLFNQPCEISLGIDSRVDAMGGKTEWFNAKFVAVDCPPSEANQLEGWLNQLKRATPLEWESAN